MTDPLDDEALVRSAFTDLRVLVPGPPPGRLVAVEATVRRRRRRRATGLVAASLLATALAVTPAVLARGEPVGTPEATPVESRTPSEPEVLGSCPSSAARQGVDVSVTATDIAMGPVFDGAAGKRRRGDMVVEVCSAGRAAAPAGTLTLRWLATVTPDVPLGSGSWRDCRAGEPESAGGVTYTVVHCDHPALPPRTAWERMFLFDMPGEADPGFERPIEQYAEAPAGVDVDTGNNRALFKNRPAEAVGTVTQPARPSCTAKTARNGVDLSVVATPLTLGPAPAEGQARRGDIAITVCNNGRAAAPAGTLTLRWLAAIPPDVQMGSGSWENCRYGEPEREAAGGGEVTYSVVHCSYAALEAGTSREHMFLFEIPGGADPDLGHPVSQYAHVSETGDTNAKDNRVAFTIATV